MLQKVFKSLTKSQVVDSTADASDPRVRQRPPPQGREGQAPWLVGALSSGAWVKGHHGVDLHLQT